MKKDELLEILCIFKDARKKLISDFVNEEELEIFIPIFKYENNKNMMSISLEKYLLMWINYHFLLIENRKSHIKKFVLKQMKQLLKVFSVSDKSNNCYSHIIFFDLIKQKQKILDDILAVDDKSKIKFNKLLYQSQKDKALFERKIKQMEDK